MSPRAHVFELLVSSWWLWNLQDRELCWRNTSLDVRVALLQLPLSPDFLCVNENMLGQLPASASCYHVFSSIMDTIPLELQVNKNSSFSCFWSICFIIATHPRHCHGKDIKEKMKEGKPQTGAAMALNVCYPLNEQRKWCLLLKHTSSLLSVKPSPENSRNHRLTTGTGGLRPPLYRRGQKNFCATVLLGPLPDLHPKVTAAVAH